jgi:prolyl-tRNA editing enzyme YbaK/EbsC (Cys-tRNA(Pro) deacylase)
MARAATGGSVARVVAALEAHGLPARVRELDRSTRTAGEAAEAVGCDVAQIVKSLVFRGAASHRPVLVVASGANRVDEAKVAGLLGEAVGKADAAYVREHTGFAIGGVAPLAHPEPITAFVDEDLLAEERVWAAAGSPNALFDLSPQELVAVAGARVADVKA